MTEPPRLVEVTAVQAIGEHRPRLPFEDGADGDVAFDEHEWRGFAPLRDQARFAEVRADSN